MDRFKISLWEVELNTLDRVNIPCLIHETSLSEKDVKITNNLQGPEKMLKS